MPAARDTPDPARGAADPPARPHDPVPPRDAADPPARPHDPVPPRDAADPPARPLDHAFYARPVVDVARDLVGCVLHHAGTSGVIVETEAYHHSEPACHAYVGLTERTRPLFGPPGHAYVYRSYGIHALVNAVCEPEGVGAAVLIRALEPLDGLPAMRERRRLERVEDLCSGPGKLTQALAIELEENEADLAAGALRILPRPADRPAPELIAGPRIGITKATELPWRFCARGSRSVSKPWPPGLLPGRPGAARGASRR